MVNDDLTSRLLRLYVAIGATEETDISKFAPTVYNDGSRIGFYQDWSGGRSDAELANTAVMLIYNIVNLKDLLKKWCVRNGKDKTKVDDAFKSSQALKIIKDLSNNDRHGYDPKKRGNSGKSPRVDRITSIMQMTTKPEKGSFISLTLNRQGVPQIAGSGAAKVIITGDILDRPGNKIGDLRETALEAVKAWESVLRDFGVKLSNDTPSNI
jgi:hypothetical protein